MPVKLVSAGSVSANYHLHISNNSIKVPVSTGLSNERTLFYGSERRDIPIEVRDARIIVTGAFGSASGSTTMAIDIGAKSSANYSGVVNFLNLMSVSAPLTTTLPMPVDFVFRFRHTLTSAVAATGASVDVWIG